MMETNGRAGGRLRLGKLYLLRCSLNWNLKDDRLDMYKTRVRIFETVESVCTKQRGNQESEVFEEELLWQSQQIRGAAWDKIQFLPWPRSPTLFGSCFPLTSSPPTVHGTYSLCPSCVLVSFPPPASSFAVPSVWKALPHIFSWLLSPVVCSLSIP